MHRQQTGLLLLFSVEGTSDNADSFEHHCLEQQQACLSLMHADVLPVQNVQASTLQLMMLSVFILL